MSESRAPGRGRSSVFRPIPRKLHFIWVGPAIPPRAAENIARWRDMHPRWQTRIWTDRDLTRLRNQRLFSEAQSIVPRDAVGQFRADVARYEILLQHGGFYADVDTYPLKPIDDSISNHFEFAVQEDMRWIGNTYLASTPGSAIMRSIVAGLESSAERNRGKRPNVISGPKYITPIWHNHKGHVAPTEWGFPYSYTDVKRGTIPDTMPARTHVVHEWDHTRRVMEARRARR